MVKYPRIHLSACVFSQKKEESPKWDIGFFAFFGAQKNEEKHR
jgi:hypothetical protein